MKKTLHLLLLGLTAAQVYSQPVAFDPRLRDTRVFVDISSDPAHWPTTAGGQKLGLAETQRAVRIALGMWQSVLPDLQVNLVSSESQANIVMRWRNYYPYCIYTACVWTGISFLPTDPDGLWHWTGTDVSCGRNSPGVSANNGGAWCAEPNNGVIAFKSAVGAGVDAVDKTSSQMGADWFKFLSDANRTHFRDASRSNNPSDPNCVKGTVPGSSWDDNCSDFAGAPNGNSVLNDLVTLVAHEFGHSLGMFHSLPPYADSWAWSRRPVLDALRFWKNPYSIMYPGSGAEVWNQRGIFDADAAVLRRLKHRVKYPQARGTLKLINKDNQVFLASDWKEAAAKMIWPTLNGGQPTSDPNQFFLVEVFPRHASRSRLTAGLSHGAGLHGDGSLRSWGKNAEGQLGNGGNAATGVPVPETPANATWRSIEAGHHHTLGIRADGSLWAWGYNEHGELGAGFLGAGTNRNTPQREATASATGWFAAKGGGGHSIALRKDGTVWAWGMGLHNQNGRADFQNSHTPEHVAKFNTSLDLNDVVAIAAGGSHNLAMRANGDLIAWGANDYGQTGIPGRPVGTGAWAPPTRFAVERDVMAVGAGWLHSLLLKRDGTVWSWGYNSEGELGLNDRTSRYSPTRIPTLSRITAIAAGPWHNLALGHDGALYAWGWGLYGQLGGISSADNLAPRMVGGDRDWVEIAAGERFSMAMKADGRVYTFGDNTFGQLATGSVGGLFPTPASSRFAVPNAPVFTETPAPTASLRPTVRWAPGGGGNGTYRYRLDNPDLSAGAASITGTAWTPGADLAPGVHTFYLQETNSQGLWSTASSHRLELDRTPPVAEVIPGVNPDNGRFWAPFALNELGNVFYTTDGTTPSPSTGLRTCGTGGSQGIGCDPATQGGLSFGNLTLKWMARDRAGNLSGVSTRRLFGIRLNFQPAAGANPDGYLVDDGRVYGARTEGHTYGWTAINTANTRRRNVHADVRYDTFNHMQQGGSFTWEIGVPNGTYSVHVVAGDPSNFNGVYRINAENLLVVDGTPSTGARFVEGRRADIVVNDGKLTLANASGSSNNKIAFLEIFRVSP